jgi:hypothetical protein
MSNCLMNKIENQIRIIPYLISIIWQLEEKSRKIVEDFIISFHHSNNRYNGSIYKLSLNFIYN